MISWWMCYDCQALMSVDTDEAHANAVSHCKLCGSSRITKVELEDPTSVEILGSEEPWDPSTTIK